MKIIDKKNILPKLRELDSVILEIGCGNRKRVADAIGIDILDYDCVDIVGEVFEVLEAIPTSSVDAIFSYHFFEHIPNLNSLMLQLERVLKNGGTIEVVVPHFSNPYFYSDYTHKSFFGLYTFCYFASSSLFQRQVPSYKRQMKCELCKVDLIFKSPPPFYVRYGFKKVLEKVINLNNYTQEFYEENLCYIFPCYEIKYILKKI